VQTDGQTVSVQFSSSAESAAVETLALAEMESEHGNCLETSEVPTG